MFGDHAIVSSILEMESKILSSIWLNSASIKQNNIDQERRIHKKQGKYNEITVSYYKYPLHNCTTNFCECSVCSHRSKCTLSCIIILQLVHRRMHILSHLKPFFFINPWYFLLSLAAILVPEQNTKEDLPL